MREVYQTTNSGITNCEAKPSRKSLQLYSIAFGQNRTIRMIPWSHVLLPAVSPVVFQAWLWFLVPCPSKVSIVKEPDLYS